jgi:hypothetical protein
MQGRPRPKEKLIGAASSIGADKTQEADPVLAERARCVAIMRDRAREFERRKLFQLARPLAALADEIAATEVIRSRH